MEATGKTGYSGAFLESRARLNRCTGERPYLAGVSPHVPWLRRFGLWLRRFGPDGPLEGGVYRGTAYGSLGFGCRGSGTDSRLGSLMGRILPRPCLWFLGEKKKKVRMA